MGIEITARSKRRLCARVCVCTEKECVYVCVHAEIEREQ